MSLLADYHQSTDSNLANYNVAPAKIRAHAKEQSRKGSLGSDLASFAPLSIVHCGIAGLPAQSACNSGL